MHPMTFHVSLLQPYSGGGATLGPLDPIVTTGKEEEYKVENILRHCQWWRVSNGILGTLVMVMIKQRIVGSQSKILSMLHRFYDSTSMLTGFSEIIHH